MLYVNVKSLIKRFSKLMDTLIDLGHVSSESADKAKRQYSKLIDNKDLISEAKKFSINSDRIDEFYAKILNSPSEVDLIVLVRLCLILSHGNARMESGFSINENLLQINMKESSIILQRLASEGIHRGGGVAEIKVTPELQKCVKRSYRTYKAARE